MPSALMPYDLRADPRWSGSRKFLPRPLVHAVALGPTGVCSCFDILRRCSLPGAMIVFVFGPSESLVTSRRRPSNFFATTISLPRAAKPVPATLTCRWPVMRLVGDPSNHRTREMSSPFRASVDSMRRFDAAPVCFPEQASSGRSSFRSKRDRCGEVPCNSGPPRQSHECHQSAPKRTHHGSRVARLGVSPRRLRKSQNPMPRGALFSVVGRCRREHSPDAWERLVFIESIGAASVRGLVTTWPGQLSIEIRRCDSCSTLIAHKRNGR
jgi:hypothetical protein